jgi:hypothetical protein
MKKPIANTRCTANHYASPGERIVEVHNGIRSDSGAKGALISLRRLDDGTFSIHVYRRDPGVIVTFEQDDQG